MTLVFHEGDFWADVPETARRNSDTKTLYKLKPNGVFEYPPPYWTMRGWLQCNDAPIARRQYDDGVLDVPLDPDEQEVFRIEVFAEFMRVFGTLSLHVLGKKLAVGDSLVHVYICSHPEHDGQGHVSRYLDSLKRDVRHVFPEVLPDSKMPGMLQRRGFRMQWVADSDDELGIYFPCMVRDAR